MQAVELDKRRVKAPGKFRRKAVRVPQDELVKAEPLQPGSALPLVIVPLIEGVDLVAWAASNRRFLENAVAKHGGVLFRNFKVSNVRKFEMLTEAVSPEALEYRERSSPRSQVKGNIYTSTDYPADQPIFLHNENSYQSSWPMKIFFYCQIPAAEGGETPIADCRKCYQRIDPEVRQRFVDKKWMYVRNFGDGFGLSWETVFQTQDKAVVEGYCAQNGIEVQWKSGNRLRTSAVRPAMKKHPKTGEMVWFNHATIFHVSTLTPAVREALLEEFAEEELPSNSYYGDGSPIEPEVLDHLREVYRAETVTFRWQRGDTLMLDNMMAAHGRAPYRGERKVLVAMAEPCSWQNLQKQRSDG